MYSTTHSLLFSCAGTDLSFQAASRQVLSALESLTTVFGMGTGGSSPPLAPAMQGKSTLKIEQQEEKNKTQTALLKRTTQGQVLDLLVPLS